jgi:hypothetical protein
MKCGGGGLARKRKRRTLQVFNVNEYLWEGN